MVFVRRYPFQDQSNGNMNADVATLRVKIRPATYDVSCGSATQDALRRDLRPWSKMNHHSLHECSSTTLKWKSLIDMLARTLETGVRACLFIVHVKLSSKKNGTQDHMSTCTEELAVKWYKSKVEQINLTQDAHMLVPERKTSRRRREASYFQMCRWNMTIMEELRAVVGKEEFFRMDVHLLYIHLHKSSSRDSDYQISKILFSY